MQERGKLRIAGFLKMKECLRNKVGGRSSLLSVFFVVFIPFGIRGEESTHLSIIFFLLQVELDINIFINFSSDRDYHSGSKSRVDSLLRVRPSPARLSAARSRERASVSHSSVFRKYEQA